MRIPLICLLELDAISHLTSKVYTALPIFQTFSQTEKLYNANLSLAPCSPCSISLSHKPRSPPDGPIVSFSSTLPACASNCRPLTTYEENAALQPSLSIQLAFCVDPRLKPFDDAGTDGVSKVCRGAGSCTAASRSQNCRVMIFIAQILRRARLPYYLGQRLRALVALRRYL